MNQTKLKQEFISRYGESSHATRTFFAPGRVNLIGDHIDYCGGLVFPCAIDKGNTLMIRQTFDNKIKLASTNFDFTAKLSASECRQRQGDQWVNYPLGVLQQFDQAGYTIHGFELLFSGNVPNAAGLSSSAAIEIVTAFAINQLVDGQFSLLELVQLAQRAENEFVGMHCGIMDQFAVAMAEADKAMRLDCQTLKYEQVPLLLGDYQIILANSNQRRELTESNYNERVEETQQALATLKPALPVEQLAEVTPSQLESNSDLFLNSRVIYRRARHVVTEQHRVNEAVSALRDDNLQLFGQLMTQSHASLRDDYQVSSKQLDTLVDLAVGFDGVLGARLTGAGFGGCTVNLVHRDRTDSFIQSVGAAYQEYTGLAADFYPVAPSDGVRELHQ